MKRIHCDLRKSVSAALSPSMQLKFKALIWGRDKGVKYDGLMKIMPGFPSF